MSEQDPLDALIQKKKAEQLRNAVVAGVEVNPDDVAKQRRLGKAMGVSPAVIPDNESAFEKAARVQSFDFDKFINEAPRLSEWAGNPENAAISSDDLETLAQIERSRRGFGEIRAMTPGEVFRMNYVNPVVRKLQGFPLTRAAIGTVGGSFGMLGNIGSFFGLHGGDRSGRNLFQRVQQSLDPSVTGADTVAMSRHLPFDTLAQNVGPMIPATLLSGGTSLIARGIGLSDKAMKVAGGLTVGAAFTADQGGATYTSMIDSGATPEQARAAANKVAAINAPVNALFGLTHLVPALESRPLATAAGMGSLQGATGRVAQNIVGGRPWNEGLPEAALEGAAMNVGMDLGFKLVGEMGTAVEAAEKSKLRTRDESAFREAMAHVFEGEEKLRVPTEQWDALWQSANRDPIQEAQRVGVDYLEARATGEVHIAKEDFLARIDPEQQKALLPDIIDPKLGMTARQYDQGQAELAKWHAEGGPEKLQKLVADVDAEVKASPEHAVVKEELRKRFEAAGERPEVAETYAATMANVYSNLARETGMKPTELLAIYDPKVKIGEAPTNAVMQDYNPANDGLTPEGSGTGLLSNEELNRQARGDAYYRVDRSGRVTHLGAQPDATVRNGEAILMVDGKTGKAQVQNSMGMGPDSAVLARLGDKVMQAHQALRGPGGGDLLFQAQVTNRELLRTSRQVIGGLEKGTFAEFKAAMKERLGKDAKGLEFGGEKGDKALKLAFEKAQEKELPGAPSTVRNVEDRQALVDRMVDMAKQGEAGRFWYDESAKAFLQLAGGDRLEAFKLATLTALYSPQTGVADNGRRAILAYYDAKHKMEVSAGGVHPNVKQLAQRVMDAKSMEEVQAVMSGQKTSAFQQNLLNLFAPEHANDDIATIDLHMMRAFGYDTEAPTPTQYKWAEQLTRDVATELGWSSPKEAQAAIWVAQKMKTDNGGKGSTAGQAGFHYGDAAKKIAGGVNVEAMPGADVVRSIFPGIDKATRAQLEQYHAEKMDIVREELQKAGVMVAGENTGHGYWDGVSNPVTSFLIPLPHIGSEAAHEMSPSARAEIERAAKVVLDLVGDQDAIGWNKPFSATSVGEANATHYAIERPLTVDEMKALGDAFSKAGFDAFIDASDPKNLKVINYNWEGVTQGGKGAAASKLAKQYHSKLNDVIINALPDGLAVEEHLFNAESGLVSKEATNASETEASRLPAEGAPAVQAGGDAGGRAKIEALNERYRREYGWGSPGPDVLYQSERAGLPEFKRNAGGPDAVAIDAVHYGNTEGLTSLNPEKSGTGSAGRERQRVRGTELEPRTYFYERTGPELPAKEGIVKASHPYETRLTNLYDLPADKLGLLGEYRGDPNGLERAILAAGYDGYITTSPGIPGRAAVVIGKGEIPVRPAGETVLNQPAYHGSPYKFDKFTLDHIGKGEGAQAYGWGLYFAGDKNVSEWYRQKLAGDAVGKISYGGKDFDWRANRKDLIDAIAKDGFSKERASMAVSLLREYGSLEAARADLGWTADGEAVDPIRKGVLDILDRMDFAKDPGQLYKVDIPEDSTMLHWDKPLSEQPEAVKAALGKLYEDANPKSEDYDANELGQSIYKRLASSMGSDKEASVALNEAGISGIKYLDGNSRTKGDGSHNYVVFDADAVKVLETYYQSQQNNPRGWFRVLPDGTFEIGKTKIGDLSTFVHEPAHSYLFMLNDLVKREGASEALKEDHKKILSFLGAKDGEELTREQHEKWARANEQYLREGKAPSEGLRGVFQRFSVWLGNIYKRASQLGVELDADIRGVFDRLYAAEEGVTKAHEDVAGPQLFKSPEEAGWTEAEYKRYADAKGIEVDQAKQDILSKLNEAALRERTAAWQAEERSVREDVAIEVDQRPEYKAIRTLRKGEMEDGTPITLNRDALVRQFGEDRVAELQRQHPNLYRNEGGVDAETAAEIMGFNSGEEMFTTLANTKKRSQAIDEGTRQFMTQKHGDIRYDGTLQDKAQLAVANEKRAENLHKELEALSRRAEAKNTPEAELKAAKKEIAKLLKEDEGQAKAKETKQTAKDMTSLADGLLKENEVKQRQIETRDQRIQELRKKIAEMEAAAVQGRKDEAAAVRLARAIPPVEAFRSAATNAIEAKPIMELEPNTYLNAQRRFSREAYDLMGRGDYWGAREAKQRELMNHFLFTEATKAKRETDATFDYVKKFGKPAIRERIAQAGGEQGQHVYLDQIDQLLEQFNFVQQSNKHIRQRQSLEAFILDQEAAGEPVAIDPSVLQIGKKNYRELNIGELRAVRDALRNVETLAKNEYGFIRDGKRISFEVEAARFDETARANLGSKLVPRTGTKFTTTEKAGRWLRGTDAYMQKMEWLVDALDKGDINGPARANIKRPIDDANARRNEMGERVFNALKKVVDARPEQDVKDALESTGVQFPGMDRPLNRSQLISWALNLGTEENRKVAILGEGLLNPDGSLRPEFDRALGALRKSELEYIQGVWDVLNGLLPDIKSKALRTTGIEPKLKKVTPFEVKTADGETVRMDGGYYPLKGDPVLNDVGRRQQDPAKQTAIGFTKPTTSTSHLKEVTGATYRLMLDHEHVLSQHLADVINDTAAGEAISQVHKFISNKKVYQTMQETLGEKEAAEFLPWLQDFANNKKGDPNEGGPLIRFLMSRRSGMVVARLGANLSSYLVQTGDVFKVLADPDVKSSYLAKAFLDIRRNPKETIEQIREFSPNEMRHREQSFNREIRDMLANKTLFEKGNGKVAEFVMHGFQVMDRLVTFPVWLARYRQGLAEHGSPERAVREADRVIARSFQAGDNRNMSHMMREQGMMKLFTTFGGDANTWYGLISSSVRSGDKTRISLGIMALVAEQIVGQAIRNRLPGDDENKAGWALEQALLAGLGKIPVLGDFAQAGFDALKGKHVSMENPTTQATMKMFMAPARIADYAHGKRDFQETAQDIVEATGLWMGIPGTSQAVRSWKYLHKVQTDKENPGSAFELVRNAVMGKTKEKKR